MRTWKRVIATLAAASMAVLGAGCGEAEDTGPDDAGVVEETGGAGDTGNTEDTGDDGY